MLTGRCSTNGESRLKSGTSIASEAFRLHQRVNYCVRCGNIAAMRGITQVICDGLQPTPFRNSKNKRAMTGGAPWSKCTSSRCFEDTVGSLYRGLGAIQCRLGLACDL